MNLDVILQTTNSIDKRTNFSKQFGYCLTSFSTKVLLK